MPDRSGWELAQDLRAVAPHASIAMVTGADVSERGQANLAVVDAVFRKPVDLERLDEFLARPT